MAFLWTGSQIPVYLFGGIPPYIYADIGGVDRWIWFRPGLPADSCGYLPLRWFALRPARTTVCRPLRCRAFDHCDVCCQHGEDYAHFHQ